MLYAKELVLIGLKSYSMETCKV